MEIDSNYYVEKMSENYPLKGRCLCGSIKYEVDKIGSRIGHCHCSMCRKFHGSAFATLADAKSSDFRWTEGEQLLEAYRAPNDTVRRFCRRCGSSMTFSPANDNGAVVEFSLGTLDSEISIRPDAHIFLDSKACWFEPEDGLPGFEAGRNSAKIK